MNLTLTDPNMPPSEPLPPLTPDPLPGDPKPVPPAPEDERGPLPPVELPGHPGAPARV